MIDATPEQEELASDLVAEALEGFDTVFTPEMLEVVRALLESELVATNAGKQMLRACGPDPTVDKSGDTTRAGVKPRTKAANDK